MAIKGYRGAVANDSTGINDVRFWKVGHSAENLAVADSGTKGAFNELRGIVDWKGFYGAYGHTPAVMPGDAFTFRGNIDTEVDKGALGTAVVRAVQIFWDWARGLPIYHTVAFEGNGALTFGATTSADAGPPDWYMSGDCVWKIAAPAASPTFLELTKRIRGSLLIWKDLAPYTDSGTANLVSRAGGNLHWAVSVDVHTEDPSAIHSVASTFGVNNVVDLQLFVDATTYWNPKWTRWKEVGELEIDIEGEKLTATRLTGYGASWYDYDADNIEEGGALTNPAASPVWTSA